MASLKKRGKTYYAQYYVGEKQKRINLDTASLQVAKARLLQLESSLTRGDEDRPVTRTCLTEILDAYVSHIRATKTPKSAQTDVYYLRNAFGAICPGLTITSRKTTAKRKPAKGTTVDGRRRGPVIEASHVEDITSAMVSGFLAEVVQEYGLAPKTANHYREIIHRFLSWGMEERGVRMPSQRNPVASVKRYREKAPEIVFLTIPQVKEQLNALAPERIARPEPGSGEYFMKRYHEAVRMRHQMQTMVALCIYAGLRREEVVWLTNSDVDLKAGLHGMIRVRAKTVNGVFWEPKTKHNRAVPISGALRQYLDAYTPIASSGDWLFPSPKGQHYIADNFSSDLALMQSECGLSWTCLIYRHTFGSQLAMKGESLYKISALMGNSPEICRRHYAHLMPESLVGCVEFDASEDGLPPQEARGSRQEAKREPAAYAAPHLRIVG